MLHFVGQFSLAIVTLCGMTAANGNTDGLRNFYRSVAKTVQTEGTKMINDHLKVDYNYNQEIHTHLQKQMIRDIQALSKMYFEPYDSTCNLFDAFKLARKILDAYKQLKPTSRNISLSSKKVTEKFEKIYSSVASQCPKIIVGSREETTNVSLLLTADSGHGKFMGRFDFLPKMFCCQFADKVDGGDQYRLQFRFEHGSNAKTLRYADVVGIWTQGKYLINSGEKLSWAEWEWNDKMRWTIKPSCQAHLDNQVVYQCDLASFITHHPDQRGRHLINSDTSERPTSGLFAILNANGQIPV